MARYIDAIDLPLPVEQAFDYLADLSRTAEWDPGVVEAERLTRGAVRLGSRFRVVVSRGGSSRVRRALRSGPQQEADAEGPRASTGSDEEGSGTMNVPVESSRIASGARRRSELLPGVGRPKGLFLLAAGLSFLMSVYLFFSGSREQGIFVGLWVPSILSAGALLLGRNRRE